MCFKIIITCKLILSNHHEVTPKVNLRNSGIRPGFDTLDRRHQKSRTGVSARFIKRTNAM